MSTEEKMRDAIVLHTRARRPEINSMSGNLWLEGTDKAAQACAKVCEGETASLRAEIERLKAVKESEAIAFAEWIRSEMEEGNLQTGEWQDDLWHFTHYADEDGYHENPISVCSKSKDLFSLFKSQSSSGA